MDGQPTLDVHPRNKRTRILALVLAAIAPGSAMAGEGTNTFASGEQQVALVELFTSQGCSSCPPAEAWLSDLETKSGLWTRFVPVAFHVDYWDRLGWTDPFGSKMNTQRQYAYRHAGGLGSVYTPGMVVRGMEWRGWRRGEDLPRTGERPGVLSVQIDADRLRFSFSGEREPLVIEYAVLGFGLNTTVPRGENAGRTLPGDFVVLYRGPGRATGSGWEALWPPRGLPAATRYALAAWVRRGNDPTPVQATGGWLETKSTVNPLSRPYPPVIK